MRRAPFPLFVFCCCFFYKTKNTASNARLLALPRRRRRRRRRCRRRLLLHTGRTIFAATDMLSTATSSVPRFILKYPCSPHESPHLPGWRTVVVVVVVLSFHGASAHVCMRGGKRAESPKNRGRNTVRKDVRCTTPRRGEKTRHRTRTTTTTTTTTAT